MFGEKGFQILMAQLGINPDEVKMVFEHYKNAIPQFAHNIDARISAIEEKLERIAKHLELSAVNEVKEIASEIKAEV